MGASTSVHEKSIHDFTVKDSKGRGVNLNTYRGKVLLVVNVAPKCRFTNSNYTQLTDLHSRLKDKGFEILAFPCNQFMKQEPGSTQEAAQFDCTRFNDEFQKVIAFFCPRARATELRIKPKAYHPKILVGSSL